MIKLYGEPDLWYDDIAGLALFFFERRDFGSKKDERTSGKTARLIRSYRNMIKILFVCHGNLTDR